MFRNYPKLFCDPNITYPINDPNLNFTDYISQTKQIIANTRLDLTNDLKETIIEANAPFELKPSREKDKRKGVLLIHGLLDSPFHVRDIGYYLQKEGYLVRAILLPGHGTVPGALLNVDYQEWLQAVRYGIQSFQHDVDDVILLGESTGASLALWLLYNESQPISNVILLSPAIKIRSPFACLAPVFKTIFQLLPRGAWFHIDENEMMNNAKYLSLTYNAIHQVYRLANELKKSESTQLPCPLFMALSQDDKIISPQAMLDFFEQQRNPNNRLILYGNKTLPFTDKRITLRKSAYPELNIVNYSHIATHISPDNDYYGSHGTYPKASHVYDHNDVTYGEYTLDDLKYNKLFLKLKLTDKHYQRLTFNPDFEYLMQEMSTFINHSSYCLETT